MEETLKALGFDEKEIAVYLEVLRRGRALPSLVAAATGINRATVYSVANKLVEKGVIAEDVGAKTMYLVALSPENLLSVLEAKKRGLKREEELVRKTIAELAAVPRNKQFTLPKIRFIDDYEIQDFLETRVDAWNESVRNMDGSWWGFQDPTFVEQYGSWIRGWFDRASSRGLRVQLVSNPTQSEKEMQQMVPEERDIRFLKEKSDFTATVWVVGEYIVMIYTQEKPFYLIEIYNPVFAQNMREVFKILWTGAIK